MRISSLRYFYEVAELKSISKVSNNLHISQPALSHQLSKLEKDLGVKLFERSNKGVELTSKGQIMYGYAKQMLILHDNLVEDISDDKSIKKELKINILNSCTNFLLNKIVKDKDKIFNDINIKINSQRDANEKALLIHNRADIVVGCRNIKDSDLISSYIGSDKFILVSKQDIDCEKLKDVSIAIFEDDSNIIFDKLKEEYKVNICLKTDSLDVIKSYLKNSDVAAIVPKIAVEEELKTNELVQVCSSKYEVDYDLFITYRKDLDIELRKKLRLFKKELENILSKQDIQLAM